MASYRLGRYRIIEDQYGQLRWESYFGFARTKTGRCFIAGNILFLEPSTEIDEPGYLIGEYKPLVDRLPQWTRTKYYCSFCTMKACDAGTTLPLKAIASQTPAQMEAVTNGLKSQVTSTLEAEVIQTAINNCAQLSLWHSSNIKETAGQSVTLFEYARSIKTACIISPIIQRQTLTD